MKSVRMVFGKMVDFVALSPADDGNFSVAYNLSSIVSLASNNSTDNPDDYSYYKVRFNPAVAISILGVFSFVFFIGFCCTCMCRRSISGGEGSRAFRRAIGNNNARNAATTGLERNVIESFPVFSYNLVKGLKAQAKGSECAVCLSDFEDEEMVRLLPKCNHAFHPECIDMWLCSHTTCPVCRTSLQPTDEPITLAIAVGVVDEQATDNGAVRIDISNDEATNEAPETSHGSTEHSLVRVRKESEKGSEWYIATAEGLKPGLHRTCSFVDIDLSDRASTSRAEPSCSKPNGSINDPGSRSNSERLGSIPMNPTSFLRTFSERAAPQPREQVGTEQPDRRAYLKRTLSWLTGGERGRDRGESQRGSRSGSSRQVDQSSPNVAL